MLKNIIEKLPKSCNNSVMLYFLPLCVLWWVTAKPDGLSVKWPSVLSLPENGSRGFVRADTLLLCERLSRLHTEVWEAVCRCGSQQQRKRRACDWGTFWLVQGAVGPERRGDRKPEPLNRQQRDIQADGGQICRDITHLSLITWVSIWFKVPTWNCALKESVQNIMSCWWSQR